MSSYPASLDALRTDLTGADDAAAVDHAGLHNAVNAAVMAVQAELGLDPSGAAATVAARLAAIEADSRWTNARTPTAHKTIHATGGSDALSPADIGAATSAQGAKADSAVQPTLIDAKGDLLVGAAPDALMRLPAAADGRLLTADASQAEGMRWATPTTRVLPGSPLSVVVPDFVGQKFVDTAQTLGAREWVATTLTAAGWIVAVGDTGWYDVPLINGWSGSVRVARVGSLLSVQIEGLNAAAATQGVCAALPGGWRPNSGEHTLRLLTSTTASVVRRVALDALGNITISNYTAGDVLYGHGATRTSAPWPTAAPV